jgi:aspartate/tyrosine/aromatic aminotransferase
MLREVAGVREVYLPSPSWGNHAKIFAAAGLRVRLLSDRLRSFRRMTKPWRGVRKPRRSRDRCVRAVRCGQVGQYAYLDSAGTGLDFGAMCADLAKLPPG